MIPEPEMQRAHLCPKCEAQMHAHAGPYNIWYCIPCKVTWDPYDHWAPEMPEPKSILVEKSTIKLYDPWAGATIVILATGETSSGTGAIEAAFLNEKLPPEDAEA